MEQAITTDGSRGIAPFLSFSGTAEQAMRFYAEVLPGAAITRLERYGKDHPFATERDWDRVLHGALSFKGHELLFLDMTAAFPAPSFSWATSLYIDCTDEAEFDLIFAALSQDGSVMMGPEAVGAIRKCA